MAIPVRFEVSFAGISCSLIETEQAASNCRESDAASTDSPRWSTGFSLRPRSCDVPGSSMESQESQQPKGWTPTESLNTARECAGQLWIDATPRGVGAVRRSVLASR